MFSLEYIGKCIVNVKLSLPTIKFCLRATVPCPYYWRLEMKQICSLSGQGSEETGGCCVMVSEFVVYVCIL